MDVELPLLCLVTDRHRCAGGALEDVVDAAVEGGVGMVQLREKDLPPARLYELARRLRDITRDRALLVVNGRLDVAMAAGADGVQLPENGIGVAAARRVAGASLLLGRSVHSVNGAVAAEAQGADLVVFGAVFATRSHDGAPPQGIELLRRASGRVAIPLLAIGGVTAENVEAVIESGASGAAVITAITESGEPREAARELVARMRESWSEHGIVRPA